MVLFPSFILLLCVCHFKGIVVGTCPDDVGDDALIKSLGGFDSPEIEYIKCLLSKNPKILNYQRKNGDSSLAVAVDHGFEDLSLFLIQQGAMVNSANTNGYTPLMNAVSEVPEPVTT